MPAKKTEEEKNPSTLMHNTRFYSRVMVTPREAQRSFNNGSFSGTDINPMYRIQRLTELFGPVGFGWWTKNVTYKFEESEATKEVHVFCELELFIRDPETKEVSEPIYGIGGNTYIAQRKSGPKASDEAMKMAYTDALGIACKALGIGHDIWYANDKTKYTMYNDEKQGAETGEQKEGNAGKQSDGVNIASTLKSIQNGIQYLTKDMSADDKNKFIKEVVVPIIGSENYVACKDEKKLQELLTDLRARAQKKNAA